MIKEKTNIAVFISGRGTNLKALILRSNKRSCNYKIVFVVSNKKNAAGLKIAKKNKILTKIISQQFLKAEQKKLAKILINKKIQFICLAGFMKILSPYFLNFFKNFFYNQFSATFFFRPNCICNSYFSHILISLSAL